FTPAAASHTVFRGSFLAALGATASSGKNPAAGAVIDYWLKTSLKKSEKPEKKDASAAAAAASGAPSASEQAKPDAGKNDGEKKDEAPKITLEILDSSGKVIRKFPKKEEPSGPADEEDFFSRGGGAASLPADAGLNRFVWDMRYEGATPVPHAPL